MRRSWPKLLYLNEAPPVYVPDVQTINRLGHITRQGPSTVRRYLTEAGWRSSHLSPRVKAYFERVKKDDSNRRKIAVVATGHYLARVMLAMLQTGECWREDEDAKQAA